MVDKEIHSHIYFVGLGGQRFANDIFGLGGNENYANRDDIVPYIGNYNPFRAFGNSSASLSGIKHTAESVKSKPARQGGIYG